MSIRCPDLPLLPGFTFNTQVGKTRFNMQPKFDFIGKGIRALVEKSDPTGESSEKYPSIYPPNQVPNLPAWIAFDKQILCFDAFFKETLQEIDQTPYQVRRVKIYYFLEDATIQVVEPKVENSGISQGTLIARHRIRMPAPRNDILYDVIDLNVGHEVEFYGRIFKIIDCDRFTRTFLNRCGIRVPDSLNPPMEPTAKPASTDVARTRPTHPFAQFLANDRKVLRFYGYWDDREHEYGYLHHLEICFHLADDTIEIKEVPQDGHGFIFLKRERMPKLFKELDRPGTHSRTLLLNVLDSRYVVDRRGCGRNDEGFYGEHDFAIGAVVNCYGRKIFLTDCDKFTKEYYRTKYGIDDFTPIPTPDDVQTMEKTGKERELPPWNGYGSYEDSAQNCITVEPKPISMDFKKFLALDKAGMDSRVLRFGARMCSRIPENCTRCFIISYHLADDTIGIFEYAAQNSGFLRKQFLKRTEVMWPGQDVFVPKKPAIYQPQDFYLGAVLNINSFIFKLVTIDDYALKYMELHLDQFPKANLKLILEKLRQKITPNYKQFVAENLDYSKMPYELFRDKLMAVMGQNGLVEHEVLTLSRAYPCENSDEDNQREYIRAVTLTELKRYLWDDLERTREYFVARDPDRRGVLTRKECYTVLRGCRLPVDISLLEKILKVIKKDEKCNLYYDDIIAFLDRNRCPLPDTLPINIKHDLCEIQSISNIYIDWNAFIKSLDLESTLK